MENKTKKNKIAIAFKIIILALFLSISGYLFFTVSHKFESFNVAKRTILKKVTQNIKIRDSKFYDYLKQEKINK